MNLLLRPENRGYLPSVHIDIVNNNCFDKNI